MFFLYLHTDKKEILRTGRVQQPCLQLQLVITSYSIHYTKLYEVSGKALDEHARKVVFAVHEDPLIWNKDIVEDHQRFLTAEPGTAGVHIAPVGIFEQPGVARLSYNFV